MFCFFGTSWIMFKLMGLAQRLSSSPVFFLYCSCLRFSGREDEFAVWAARCRTCFQIHNRREMIVILTPTFVISAWETVNLNIVTSQP